MKASFAQFHRFLKSSSEMMKREKRYFWSSVVSLFLWILTLALPLWKIVPIALLKPFIPLHYNVLFGIDRYGPWYAIFWIPVFGLLTLLLNIALGTSLYHKEQMMTTLLFFGGLGVQLILLCSMFLIVLLNL